MISKTSDSKDANTSSTNESHLDDLKVKNGEAQSDPAAGHPGVDTASAGIQQNLQVVKESMAAAAMIQHGLGAAKTGGEYVRDNVWNWH